MIDVTFDPPVNGVSREVLTGLRPDGSLATRSVEAVDFRVRHYASDGTVVNDGLVSQGVTSLIRSVVAGES